MAKETYKIVIKNETAKGSSKAVAGSKTAEEPAETSNSQNLVKGLVAYNKYVKPFAKQAIQHQINTVELRTGSAELQQRISFGYEIASTVIGIGENIAVGGLIGGAAGAIMGAFIGVLNMQTNIYNNRQVIGLQRANEDETLRLLNLRAGGALSTCSKSRDAKQ